MRTSVGVLIAVATMLSWATPAAAQRTPVPDKGMVGIGVTAGVALPLDSSLDSGFDLAAQVEGYLTRRVSIRAQLSKAWNDVTGRPFTGQVKPFAFDGDVVYNWEHGVWHPYASAGVGVYHYAFTENGIDSSDNKFGAVVGVGIEYFLTRHDTLVGEVDFHAIPGNVTSYRSAYEAGYWTFSGGYKRFFGK